MSSKTLAITVLLTATAALSLPSAAHAGVYVGVRLGGPCYYPGGYYRPYGYYGYGPGIVIGAPVVGVAIAPAPVYIQPAPIVVQQTPGVVTVPPAPVVSRSEPPLASNNAAPATGTTAPAPIPTLVAASASTTGGKEDEINRQIQLLFHADDKTRTDAAMELGRLRADRATDALVSLLSQDRSSQVRESAARALGLIGSQRALPALARAAQSDADRDVRRSAQYTIEVIHNQLRGN